MRRGGNTVSVSGASRVAARAITGGRSAPRRLGISSYDSRNSVTAAGIGRHGCPHSKARPGCGVLFVGLTAGSRDAPGTGESNGGRNDASVASQKCLFTIVYGGGRGTACRAHRTSTTAGGQLKTLTRDLADRLRVLANPKGARHAVPLPSPVHMGFGQDTLETPH
jgi:hypothetical protein